MYVIKTNYKSINILNLIPLHVRDVWSQHPRLQVVATSIGGSTLKIDSTKTVRKKLLGAAASSTTWATNVGNERAEVLPSVLTESESMSGYNILMNILMNSSLCIGTHKMVERLPVSCLVHSVVQYNDPLSR